MPVTAPNTFYVFSRANHQIKSFNRRFPQFIFKHFKSLKLNSNCYFHLAPLNTILHHASYSFYNNVATFWRIQRKSSRSVKTASRNPSSFFCQNKGTSPSGVISYEVVPEERGLLLSQICSKEPSEIIPSCICYLG